MVGLILKAIAQVGSALVRAGKAIAKGARAIGRFIKNSASKATSKIKDKIKDKIKQEINKKVPKNPKELIDMINEKNNERNEEGAKITFSKEDLEVIEDDIEYMKDLYEDYRGLDIQWEDQDFGKTINGIKFEIPIRKGSEDWVYNRITQLRKFGLSDADIKKKIMLELRNN